MATELADKRGTKPLAHPDEAYVLVDYAQPHPSRARAILANHPEVRGLFGPSHLSAAMIVALVGAQLVIAWYLIGKPWWLMLAMAIFVGAFIDHALWVLVHECAHGLVFRRSWLNKAFAIIANFAWVFPSTISFSIYHLKHHTFLGHTQHDADIAPLWEARLLHGGPLGRFLWMALYPITQITRSFAQPTGREPVSWTRWIWPNIVAVFLFDLLFYYVVGWGCFRYLVVSVYFSIGPHPLGARWIQEHSVFRDGQETYSYYGPLNVVSLNIGYHNEHHDLPQVAWHRLPRLKRLAPEMYEALYYHTSLVGLWLQFLFNPQVHIYRMARSEQYAKVEPPGSSVIPGPCKPR